MTPEELLIAAHTWSTLPEVGFGGMRQLAQAYVKLHADHVALSVKLEETQEELESNRRCNLFTWKERAEQAEVKLEEANARDVAMAHQTEITVEFHRDMAARFAEDRDIQKHARREAEAACASLRVKLEAAEQEREQWRVMAEQSRATFYAQRKCLDKICPQCQAHVPMEVPQWYCDRCEGYIAPSSPNVEPVEASRGEVVKPQERMTAYDNIADVLYVTWDETTHAESIAPQVLLRLTDDGRVGGVTVLDHKGRGEVVKACPRCWQFTDDQGLGVSQIAGGWACSSCGDTFTEPAYWQRVNSGSETRGTE